MAPLKAPFAKISGVRYAVRYATRPVSKKYIFACLTVRFKSLFVYGRK